MRSITAITFLCISTFIKASEASFSWANITSVVAFGDSYSSVQGTAGYSNHSFIGSYLPGQYGFNRTTLLQDRIIQNYTSTSGGGPLWLQYLTGCAARKGIYRPSYCRIKLWNFAYYGASFSEQFFARHKSFVIPVVNQTQQYLEYADSVLQLNKTNSLAVLWFGINDIFDTNIFYRGNLTNEQLWTQVINASFEQSVTPLLRAGFKNLLILNVPPIDRIPLNINMTNPYPTPDHVNLWNSILSNQLQSFASNNNGTRIMMYDDNAFLNNVLDNPTNYKIKKTKSYCKAIANPDVVNNPGTYGCHPLNQYFWFSGAHMWVLLITLNHATPHFGIG